MRNSSMYRESMNLVAFLFGLSLAAAFCLGSL